LVGFLSGLLYVGVLEMAEKTEDTASPMKRIMTWAGYATALIGLGGSLLGGVRWYQDRREHKAENAAKMAAAEALDRDGQYKAAIESYGAILKDSPLDAAALKGQLKTAMDWSENFHTILAEGQRASDVAGPDLDEMMAVLNGGLARSSGTEAADVQSHLGWAHWLNQHIAEREFGSEAMDNFQAALKVDPRNVYAHAMLGNYKLQNNGSFTEAVGHLNTAVATGKARPFVRRLQIGGLNGMETPGARAEVFKAANDMRKNNEPLEDGMRSRIRTFCCEPADAEPAELKESFTALPQDEAWQTYLWLDQGTDPRYADAQRFARAYVEAYLLEANGKKAEALKKYQALQVTLKGTLSSLQGPVNSAVKRLSQG
jgi:tetratricopeptide (TPR) repeat protein